MATQRTFENMLNEYITLDLMNYELERRNYVYKRANKDEKWLGGNLIVPFEGAQATTFQMEGFAEANDIAQDEFVRGQVNRYKEAWGSMIFNYKDLREHDKLSVQNFLKILPGRVERFMDYIGQMTSIQMTKGPNFAEVTVNGTTGGVLTVDRIDRFTINQKIHLRNTKGNTSNGDFFVTAVDVNNSTITVSGTRGGAPVNVSAYQAAREPKIYLPGTINARGESLAFNSISDALLSQANGGSAQLLGQSKTAYPYLQAINVNGASITGTSDPTNNKNLLTALFDAYSQYKIKARNSKDVEFLMSYKHFGTAMKLLQQQKGPFRTTPGKTMTEEFGFSSISILGVDGRSLKLIAIQEMPDSEIFMMDWSAVKVYSNGGFKKVQSPDGNSYHTVRNAGANGGYQFICDICFFGELVVINPSKCGIIYNIGYN